MTKRSLFSYVHRSVIAGVSTAMLAVVMAGCGEEAPAPPTGTPDTAKIDKVKDAMKGPAPKAAPEADKK